jgi:phosphate-selective porin OprO/OprP
LAEEGLSVDQKIASLQQQIDILKRQLEVDKEVSTQKAKDAPIVTASAKDGFSIKAQDDSYKLKLSGYAQADARIFPDNKKDTGTTDTFTTRTVRLVLSGTVANDFDYYIAPEFAGTSVSLPDAYLDWRLDPALKLRGGKFKAPFAYERLQSTTAATFAEAGLAENLAPNRDNGFQVYGDLFNESLNYAVALTNGVVDAGGSTSAADTNNDKEVGARLFAQPFKSGNILALRGLGFGGAVSYGHREDTSLPSYKTAGQTTFYTLTGTTFDGPQLRYSPQIAYYNNSFGVYGEYIASEAKLTKTTKRQAVKNDGWQVAGSYVLTGEDASYKGIAPLRPFNLKKGDWGAFELTGRYSTLDIDNKIFDSALTTNSINSTPTEARAWTAGLNWYLNRNTKLVFNWEQAKYKGGAAGGADRITENLLLSRFQVSF